MIGIAEHILERPFRHLTDDEDDLGETRGQSLGKGIFDKRRIIRTYFRKLFDPTTETGGHSCNHIHQRDIFFHKDRIMR